MRAPAGWGPCPGEETARKRWTCREQSLWRCLQKYKDFHIFVQSPPRYFTCKYSADLFQVQTRWSTLLSSSFLVHPGCSAGRGHRRRRRGTAGDCWRCWWRTRAGQPAMSSAGCPGNRCARSNLRLEGGIFLVIAGVRSTIWVDGGFSNEPNKLGLVMLAQTCG